MENGFSRVNEWAMRHRGSRMFVVMGRFFAAICVLVTSRIVYRLLRISAAGIIVFAAIAHAKTGRFFYIPAALLIYLFAFYLLPKLWKSRQSTT